MRRGMPCTRHRPRDVRIAVSVSGMSFRAPTQHCQRASRCLARPCHALPGPPGLLGNSRAAPKADYNGVGLLAQGLCLIVCLQLQIQNTVFIWMHTNSTG